MNSDILVSGAGPAGLSFAALAAQAGFSVTVVEKQPEAALVRPADDGREVALTHLSRAIMTEAGLWRRIPRAAIGRIREAKVLDGDSPYALHFQAREAGQDSLGFMVSNHRIRRAAYGAALAQPSVQLIAGAEVVDAATDSTGASVTLDDGRVLRGRLLVAADSRFSPLRTRMGIAAAQLNFHRVCIVCRMSISRPHNDTAYECFQGPSTLALLPLAGAYCSVVITVAESEAERLISLSPANFARHVEDAAGHRLGRMALAGERFAYPLVAVYADRFHARRFALLGDAAVGMHPVTAHGFNFGLRGAQTLVRELRAAADVGLEPGDAAALGRYNHLHRQATWPTYEGTNALVRLYTRTTPLARLARKALLRLGNRLTPAHRLILRQLTEVA